MTRINEIMNTTPIINLSVIATCNIIYLYQFLFDPNLLQFTMCPRNILFLREYYRIITCALFHGSLMHLGMNMMSTFAIGSALERRFGSIVYLLIVLWGILLTALIYLGIALAMFYIGNSDHSLLQNSVGFSGVIFLLSVLEANTSHDSYRSVFGMISVPTVVYPWALLIAAQFIMPNISFLGHLSGIVVGTMMNLWVCLLFPKANYVRDHMEKWKLLHFLTACPSFIPLPNNVERMEDLFRGNGDAQYQLLTGVFTFIYNVLETLKVIVFGRNYESRRNEDLDLEEEPLWVVNPSSSHNTRQNDLEMNNRFS